MPAGSQTVNTVAAFDFDNGSLPNSLLVVGNTIYGTTSAGGEGEDDVGTVFSLPIAGGDINTLASFAGDSNPNFNDLTTPSSSLTLSGGTLYGTAQSGGAT